MFRSLSFLTLLVWAQDARAQNPAQDRHESLFLQGKSLAAKDPKTALRILDSALVIARAEHKRLWEFKDLVQVAACRCNAGQFDEADKVFAQLNGQEGEANAEPDVFLSLLGTKGNCALRRGAADEAVKFYDEALDHPAASPLVRLKISLNKANALNIQLKHREALQALIRAEPEVQKVNDPFQRFLFHNSMGYVYADQADAARAIRLFKDALAVTGAPAEARLSAAYSIGNQYSLLSSDSALFYYHMVVDHRDEATAGTYNNTLSALTNWFSERNLDSADHYIRLWEAAGADRAGADYLFKKSRILFARGRFAEGIPVAEQALKTYREEMGNDISFGNDILANLVKARVRATKDPSFIADFTAWSDSLRHQQRRLVEQEVEKFRVAYETEKVEQANARLAAENRAKARTNWLLGLAAALAGGLAATIYRKKQQEKTLNALLQRDNEAFRRDNESLLELVGRLKTQQPVEELTIRLGGQDKRVLRLVDIVCVKADGNYVDIHTTDGRVHSEWQTIRSIGEVLVPSGLFYQVHRSWIVNHRHIAQRKASELGLSNKKIAPIGATFRPAAERWLDERLG